VEEVRVETENGERQPDTADETAPALMPSYEQYYRAAVGLIRVIAILLAIQTAIMGWREFRQINHCREDAARWDRDVARFQDSEPDEEIDREEYPTFWRCMLT
jgi:hypothetical protein